MSEENLSNRSATPVPDSIVFAGSLRDFSEKVACAIALGGDVVVYGPSLMLRVNPSHSQRISEAMRRSKPE